MILQTSAIALCRRISIVRMRQGVAAIMATLAFAALLLFARLDDRDLWPSHEARAAQNAIHVLNSHSPGLTRLLDGTPEYQKPPMYYWLVAAGALFRGEVDALAVRIPAALSAWITIAAIVYWFSRRGRSIAGCLSGLTLLCANHFVATGRTGRIDAPIMACVTLAILWWETRPVFVGCILAASLLLKGPIGIVLASGVMCIFRWRDSRRVVAQWGIAVAIAGILAAPWFIAACIESQGEFARVFFWRHNLGRATGDMSSHPWWFYLARWCVDYLPATPALVGSLVLAWKRNLWRNDEELRLGLVWMAAITAMLSLASFKRADYLMAAYPGAAIVVGCVGERYWSSSRAVVFASTATMVAAIAGYCVFESKIQPDMDRRQQKATWAASVREFVPAGRDIVLFRVEDHLLAYHLHRPITSIREWSELEQRIAAGDLATVIMPINEAVTWANHLPNARLQPIVTYNDPVARERPRSWVAYRIESRRECHDGFR